jgi:hypothetical protein
MLYLPAWTVSLGTRGAGIEVMGQRLIFMMAYVLVLALVLFPPVALGGLAWLLLNGIVGISAAMLAAALIGCATLCMQLVFAVDLLGRRIDRFDVSQEMPR